MFSRYQQQEKAAQQSIERNSENRLTIKEIKVNKNKKTDFFFFGIKFNEIF